MDLTADIARERDLTIDEEGFEREMEAQRERARSASSFGIDYNSLVKIDSKTEFLGYTDLEASGQIVSMLKDGQPVEQAAAGDELVIVLDKTPFYAESGGQVGDCGYLLAPGVRFEVRDTSKAGEAFLHHGVLLEGSLNRDTWLQAKVDAGVRQATVLNHSATHLLHAALREILGEHVQQKGSLVDSQRLRFDFSHFEALTAEQIIALEDRVNQQVRLNTAVEICETDMDTAKQMGAMALFGEKYGNTVRVLSMGDGFSVELCGGTHAKRTGDIGLFKIVSEGGIAAGVRRIEAVTGELAWQQVKDNENTIRQMVALVKGNRENLLDKLRGVLDHGKALEKELQQAKAKAASVAGSDLAGQAKDINGVKALAAQIDGLDNKALMDLMDQLKNKLGSGVILLASVVEDRVVLVAGVTKDLVGRYKAGDLMRQAAATVGGKGGGRPDMAQGGGSDAAAVPAALAMLEQFVAGQGA
jgi:alanyl-tRNA synthetase